MTSAARAPYDLGSVRITLLNGGRFKLDGGAMFGIIPKPLWSRAMPADESNRIQLACNCLLVEWEGPGGRRAIVETGHGAKFGAKEQQIFGIDPTDWLLPSLRTAGIDPSGVSDVIVTHLHFDHAGGLTRAADGASPDAGVFVPTFPAARVHVQKREFEDARSNFGVMRNTYREENFAPLDAQGAWVLHEGAARPLPNVRLIPTPGHTRAHQSVLIEGRERAALFVGDVMPTTAHVGWPYNMGYDLFPLDNVESKRRLLSEAAEREWLLVIDHDPSTPFVRAIADGPQRYRLEPVS